jgi:hypothetical protein
MAEIDFTVLAERQYAALKGPCRKAMDEFLRELARAAGPPAQVTSHLCGHGRSL